MGALKLTYQTHEDYPYLDVENTPKMKVVHNRRASQNPSVNYYAFGMEMPGRTFTSESYRFGYQGQFSEKDEETGYNSFELRLYDSRIGRWLTTDPYGQHWSPYMAMGNNPLLMIDADGGLDDPVYGSDGNHRGNTVEGFTGTPIIYDGNVDFTSMTNSQLLAVDGATPLNMAFNLSLEAQSNIYTHVLNQMPDIDFSKLYNGAVSIRDKAVRINSQTVVQGFNDPANYPRYGHSDAAGGTHKITIQKGSHISELYTVELIQNYIGVHEYYAHGILGFSGGKKLGGTHWKAYGEQHKHHTYDKLPKDAQNEIFNRMRHYMQYENPRLYYQTK